MNWILDHLQLAIALAIALAAWLKRMHTEWERAKNRADGPRKFNHPSSPARSATDDTAAQRTREVQAEIRKKIAERTRSIAAQTATRPRERAIERATTDPFSSDELRKNASWEKGRSTPAEEQRTEEIQKQAERLRESRRHLLRTARETRDLPPLVNASSIPSQPIAAVALEPSEATAQAWRAALNDPEAVRRAIILNEILGRPVGLR